MVRVSFFFLIRVLRMTGNEEKKQRIGRAGGERYRTMQVKLKLSVKALWHH